MGNEIVMLSELTKSFLFTARASAKGVSNIAYSVADTIQVGASAQDRLAEGDLEASQSVILRGFSQMTPNFEQTMEETNCLIDAAINSEKEFFTKGNADRLASLVPLGFVAVAMVSTITNEAQQEK